MFCSDCSEPTGVTPPAAPTHRDIHPAARDHCLSITLQASGWHFSSPANKDYILFSIFMLMLLIIPCGPKANTCEPYCKHHNKKQIIHQIRIHRLLSYFFDFFLPLLSSPTRTSPQYKTTRTITATTIYHQIS